MRALREQTLGLQGDPDLNMLVVSCTSDTSILSAFPSPTCSNSLPLDAKATRPLSKLHRMAYRPLSALQEAFLSTRQKQVKPTSVCNDLENARDE